MNSTSHCNATITLTLYCISYDSERFVRQVQNYSLEHALPELYLHGLAQGDFALALQRLSCQDTPLSGSTLAHMKKAWQEELAQWQCWSLEDLEADYFWSDGLYVKAKLEKARQPSSSSWQT